MGRPFGVWMCGNVEILFGNHHWEAPVSISGGQSWAATSLLETVTLKLTKKAAVKLSDHTPITYLWSTSQASFNRKNGFRRFVPHIICSKNQFSTPEKENAHRHSLQSFELILLLSSFVSGIVKKRALNQNQNSNITAKKLWKFSLLPKAWGPPKLGALGLSLFSLMVNPRLL